MLLKSYEKEMKQISTGRANPNIFFGVIFDGIAINLKTLDPFFSSFNPCPSLPSVAKDDRKKFQYLKIILNTKTGQLFFEFN